MVVGIKKFTMEYVVPTIAKNLTKLRKIKDEGFKAVDDTTKGTSVPVVLCAPPLNKFLNVLYILDIIFCLRF